MKKKFIKMFLYNLLLVSLAVLIPVIIISFNYYFTLRDTYTREIDSAHKNTLVNSTQTIDMLYRQISYTISGSLANTDIIDYLSTNYSNDSSVNHWEEFQVISEIQTFFSLVIKHPLEYNATIYSSLHDRFVSYRFGGDSVHIAQSKRLINIFEENKNKDFFYVVRDIFPENLADKFTMISFFTKVHSNSFLVIDVSIKELANFISVDNNHLLLVQNNSTVIMETAGNRSNLELSSLFPNDEFLEQFSASNSGTAHTSMNGIPVTAIWSKSEIPDLKLLTFLPSEEYNTSLNDIQNQISLFFVFVVVLALIITLFASNRLYKPIREIIKIVENPQVYSKKELQNNDINYLLMDIVDSFMKNNILEEDIVRNMIMLDNAHVRVLQKQITPHFLHNVLQAISWMSVEETGNENSKTSESIILLSEIVRAYMQQSDILTTVKDEIDYVKKYTKIEELRFNDSITYHYDINKTLLDCNIPRLSIQPIIENAINHGIKPKPNSSGNIYIKIDVFNGRLRCKIDDDGVGISNEELDKLLGYLNEKYTYVSRHIGIVNLAQRIKLVYRDNTNFNIAASSYGGVKIEFIVPIVRNTPPNTLPQ